MYSLISSTPSQWKIKSFVLGSLQQNISKALDQRNWLSDLDTLWNHTYSFEKNHFLDSSRAQYWTHDFLVKFDNRHAWFSVLQTTLQSLASSLSIIVIKLLHLDTKFLSLTIVLSMNKSTQIWSEGPIYYQNEQHTRNFQHPNPLMWMMHMTGILISGFRVSGK